MWRQDGDPSHPPPPQEADSPPPPQNRRFWSKLPSPAGRLVPTPPREKMWQVTWQLRILGQKRHFPANSLTKGFSKKPFYQNRCGKFYLPYCSVKVCPPLSCELWRFSSICCKVLSSFIILVFMCVVIYLFCNTDKLSIALLSSYFSSLTVYMIKLYRYVFGQENQ